MKADYNTLLEESINSSKVYCKFIITKLIWFFIFCINSSKVYCKCKKLSINNPVNTVLIVAKCIVN